MDSMKQKRLFAWSLGGAFLAVAASIALLASKTENSGDGSGKGGGSGGLEGERGEKGRIGSEVESVRPMSRRPATGASEASRRLLDLQDGGDKPAIHEEISTLAQAGRLAEVEAVLRTWCRAGEMELAQWALEFSAQSDPSLHLVLCAQALSHRSDVIRDSALANLEQASGLRFEDSAQALLWLEGKKKQ
jgi:hypothetical protein